MGFDATIILEVVDIVIALVIRRQRDPHRQEIRAQEDQTRVFSVENMPLPCISSQNRRIGHLMTWINGGNHGVRLSRR